MRSAPSPSRVPSSSAPSRSRLRVALTGRTTSPGIFDVLAVLGKDECLARLGDLSARTKGPLTAQFRPSCGANSNKLRKIIGAFPAACGRAPLTTFQPRPVTSIRGIRMDDQHSKSATLTVGNKNYDFPIKSGSIGPDVVDISTLYNKAGIFTYDPGFLSTASCESKITYIDGEAGILRYRGYPIEQVAEGDFLETCYLLLEGDLPNKAQKADFVERVTNHTMVHEQMARFFQGFRRDAHPMAVMVASVGALSRVLSRLHRHQRSAPAHGRLDAHDRQGADAGGDGLQVHDRPAVHLSAEQSRLRVELHADVLCGAVRGVQGQSGARARARQDLHPARRPRAERIDQHGAFVRLLRRQPVRLHRGRHRLPVGTGAWRRERSRAEDADRDRRREEHPGLHQARQGQGRPVPRHGLRPPRLQELRSARQDHAEALP